MKIRTKETKINVAFSFSYRVVNESVATLVGSNHCFEIRNSPKPIDIDIDINKHFTAYYSSTVSDTKQRG